MTVPIGTIMAYAGEITESKGILASQGWLLCDGQEVTKVEYPLLDRVIGTYYGKASDAEHFKLPDLRGRFVRGVDRGAGRDPDASSRKASDDGGNSGDKVGSLQEDAMQFHSHEDKGHKHTSYHLAAQKQQERSDGQEYSNWSGHKNLWENDNTGRAQLGDPVQSGNHKSPRCSEETRPKNIYVNWIIKAKN